MVALQSQGITEVSKIHPLGTMNELNCMAINSIVVELFKSGPKWWTLVTILCWYTHANTVCFSTKI